MTIEECYTKLAEDGQVWHEGDYEGYHFYMADTSFGDGPFFKVSGNGKHRTFNWGMDNSFVPGSYREGTKFYTTEKDREWIEPMLDKVQWTNRLKEMSKKAGHSE